jgi:hypothetical protein
VDVDLEVGGAAELEAPDPDDVEAAAGVGLVADVRGAREVPGEQEDRVVGILGARPG